MLFHVTLRCTQMLRMIQPSISRMIMKSDTFSVQIEGKKFYLQPSLGATSGNVIPAAPYQKMRFHRRQKDGGHTHNLHLRFESAPILQLRKILLPSNPDHAKILRASVSDGQERAAATIARVNRDVSGQHGTPPSCKACIEFQAVAYCNTG